MPKVYRHGGSNCDLVNTFRVYDMDIRHAEYWALAYWATTGRPTLRQSNVPIR